MFDFFYNLVDRLNLMSSSTLFYLYLVVYELNRNREEHVCENNFFPNFQRTIVVPIEIFFSGPLAHSAGPFRGEGVCVAVPTRKAKLSSVRK